MGSQALHATLHESQIPQEVLSSREVDATYIPGIEAEVLASNLNTADVYLGEESTYHLYNGFHMEFVAPGTAILPSDWVNNLKKLVVDIAGQGPTEFTALGIYDAAASKLMRLDDKDRIVIGALLDEERLDAFSLQGIISGELEASPGYTDIDTRRQNAIQFLEQWI